MIRVPKPALTLFAGLVVIIASACSSAGTPAPGGSGAPAGGSGAPAGGSGAPTSAVSTVNPNDPNSIITAALAGEAAIKSFHIKIEVSGTVSQAALASTGGVGAGVGAQGDLKLDGTVVEGDVDVANSAAHLTVALPTVPVTGDLILVDGNLYYKLSLLGPKYTETSLSSLSSLAGSLPVAVPTADASVAAGLTDQLNQLRTAMDQAGVTATLVGVEQIGGQDAYHINVSIPLDKLNAEIASAAASSSPGMTIDSASLDAWIYKDSSRLAKVELKGASSAIGNIDFVLTITNYDAPVTIAAPAASEVNATTP